jgi:hypothetical protein
MSIVTSLLNRLKCFTSPKLTKISLRPVLTLIRVSFPIVHANIEREWYSQSDVQQFQMNVFSRRAVDESVGRPPLAR